MIEVERKKRGVLAFVDDKMLGETELIGDYKVVTEDTSDEELRAMGKKANGKYPVKLITKKYG